MMNLLSPGGVFKLDAIALVSQFRTHTHSQKERTQKGVSSMSTEENKAIARRYFEGLNKANLTIADELFSPDSVTYMPGSPPMNREGVKQAFSMFSSAFTNLTHTLEDQTVLPFVALIKGLFLVSLPLVSKCT